MESCKFCSHFIRKWDKKRWPINSIFSLSVCVCVCFIFSPIIYFSCRNDERSYSCRGPVLISLFEPIFFLSFILSPTFEMCAFIGIRSTATGFQNERRWIQRKLLLFRCVIFFIVHCYMQYCVPMFSGNRQHSEESERKAFNLFLSFGCDINGMPYVNVQCAISVNAFRNYMN